MQDMRAPDTLHEPVMGSTPSYSYNNKIATNYESKRTGDKFLPLPGPYIPSPGEITRGGAYPHTRDLEPGNALGSIVESLNAMEGIVGSNRQANQRDYERSTVGRISNYKPKKN